MSVLSWPAVVGTAININVATLGAVGSGDFTIAVLCKPAGNAGHIGLTTGSGNQYQLLNDSGLWFGGADFSGFGTANTTDWHVIGHGKTSGTNVYRWHYWNYSAGGAKTHADGTGTHPNPGTITGIKIGDCDNRGNGLIAMAAIWKSKIADAVFDSICTTKAQDWAAAAPDALWPLNVAAASVVDKTGHGNDASSVTGTISLTGTDPPGFDFTISSGISQALPVASETDASIAFGRRKSRTLVIAGETDSGLTIVGRKRRALALAAETDGALTLGGGQAPGGSGPRYVQTGPAGKLVQATPRGRRTA